MKIQPTVAEIELHSSPGGGTQSQGLVYDVSDLSPEQQYQNLVQRLQAADAAAPAPDTVTPPWGEYGPVAEDTPEYWIEDNYLLAADVDSPAVFDMQAEFTDAPGGVIPLWDYENDPQYFGLGVPPGVPAWDQPIESGHTQITLVNPSAELGWDAWSGRAILARTARHENMFTRYNSDQSRGHELDIAALQGGRSGAEYNDVLNYQRRNMMMTALQNRGMHNVVIDDVPAPTYTQQVTSVNPVNLPQEGWIGDEGVLP